MLHGSDMVGSRAPLGDVSRRGGHQSWAQGMGEGGGARVIARDPAMQVGAARQEGGHFR